MLWKMPQIVTRSLKLTPSRVRFTAFFEAANIAIMLILISLVAVHSKARAQAATPRLNTHGFVQADPSAFIPTPRLQFIANFNAYKVFKIHLQQLGSEDRIHYFHQHIQNAEEYVIIDKKNRSASFYNLAGQPYRKMRIQISDGDELTAGGAGIYRATSWSSRLQFLMAEKDKRIRPLLQINSPIASGSLVYILPNSKDHQFFVRDSQLVFMAGQVKRNRTSFNYTPVTAERTQISFRKDPKNDFLNRYMLALENEKLNLMSLTGLEDDEYNMLAELALGVLAPETQNGKSLKYFLKEAAPWLVSLLKGNGLNIEDNSRGPTQIKKIPDVIIQHYQLDKSDLSEPENAAITTLVFVAELAKDLRNIAHHHPKINEFNLSEYIYYLYQGRRPAITKGTATPDQNLNIKMILAQANHYPLTRNLIAD